MSRWIQALAALMLAAALAACGGGGGGDAPKAALSFSPGTLSANFTSGTSATLTVRATASDPSAFAGTLYVYVVDPNHVLTGTVNLAPFSANAYTATLYTSASLPAGRHQGTLQVQLCYDAGCARQVPGSPVSLPYDFNVGAAPLSATPATSTAGTVHKGGTLSATVSVDVRGPSLPWTATTAAGWLRVTPGADSFSVGYATATLAEGHYADKVTVRSSDGQTVDVPFSLDVLPTEFSITSGVPTFSAVNGAPIAAQALAFELNNGVASPWSATSSAAWLVASALSGTTPATISLQPNPSLSVLASGSHSADLVLASPGIASKTVTSQINLTPATLSVAADTVTLGGPKGRDLSTVAPLAMSLNTGTASWPWTLSTLPGWLSSGASSGTVNQSGTNLTLIPLGSGITAGSVSATVTVTATVNGDTIARPITVNLNADKRRLLASDWGVGFASTPTGSVLTRTITVRDNLGASVPWTAVSDKTWLTVTASGTTSGAAGGTVTLTANPATLPAEVVSYANVTVSTTATGASAAVVRVGLWKSASGLAGVMALPVADSTLAVDRIRPYVYTHNNGSSIDIYNAYSQQKVGSFTNVAPALGRMAVSADGSRLYVLDTTNGAIVVIDLFTQAKVATWPLGHAVTAGTGLLSIRPNGVEVQLLDDGTAYTEGRSLGATGIFGLMTASQDGRRVWTQNTLAAPSSTAAFDVDYSAISGGVLMVSQTASGSVDGVYGRDIAASPDGSRLYAGAAPPYECASINPTTLALVGGLPGVQPVYLNNVEVASNGRVVCGGITVGGVGVLNTIEVHAIDGTLLKTETFSVAGDTSSSRNGQMVLTPDGLVAVLRAGDASLVFVPIVP